MPISVAKGNEIVSDIWLSPGVLVVSFKVQLVKRLHAEGEVIVGSSVHVPEIQSDSLNAASSTQGEP